MSDRKILTIIFGLTALVLVVAIPMVLNTGRALSPVQNVQPVKITATLAAATTVPTIPTTSPLQSSMSKKDSALDEFEKEVATETRRLKELGYGHLDATISPAVLSEGSLTTEAFKICNRDPKPVDIYKVVYNGDFEAKPCGVLRGGEGYSFNRFILKIYDVYEGASGEKPHLTHRDTSKERGWREETYKDFPATLYTGEFMFVYYHDSHPQAGSYHKDAITIDLFTSRGIFRFDHGIQQKTNPLDMITVEVCDSSIPVMRRAIKIRNNGVSSITIQNVLFNGDLQTTVMNHRLLDGTDAIFQHSQNQYPIELSQGEFLFAYEKTTGNQTKEIVTIDVKTDRGDRTLKP